MDDARALLNSLMGNDRNSRPEERKIRKFTDDDVCKNFLLGLCPHDLFKNTKIDLGCCDKEHNDFLKEAFDGDADRAKYKRKWRGNLRVQLRRLLDGVDRRAGLNQSRIARESEGGLAGASEEQKQQLGSLKEQVSERLKEAERAADEGRFDDSRRIMTDTETTKRRIEDLEAKRYEKYRKELCCEICGQIIDAEEQEANKTGRGWHIAGKQHIGYGQIRAKLKELEKDQADDRKNGQRSPSPSPVKPAPRAEVKKRKSPSPPRGQKADARKRKGSKSRSPSRGKKADAKRRKCSRSRSRRRKGSRSRSAKGKKADVKKRADSSSDRRSRSRKRKSRSRSRKGRSRSRSKKKKAKESSPRKRSRSPDGDKKKKGSKHDSAKLETPKADAKPAKADSESVGAPGADPKKEKKKAKAAKESSKGEDAQMPAAPSEPAPSQPPAPAEDDGARNRKAPVFMVFRPTPASTHEAAKPPQADAANASDGKKEKKKAKAAKESSKGDDSTQTAPAPAPPPEPTAAVPEAPPEDQGARNRKAPVFMVFRPKSG